jgi:hypothetical protein
MTLLRRSAGTCSAAGVPSWENMDSILAPRGLFVESEGRLAVPVEMKVRTHLHAASAGVRSRKMISSYSNFPSF